MKPYAGQSNRHGDRLELRNGRSRRTLTLEAAGVEFTNGDVPGVRLHAKKKRGK
jgi:hypothetical protein